VTHQHLIINATFNKTPFTEVSFTNSWIRNIVKIIDMEILHDPISVRCDEKNNEGISGFCLITTSHISLHSWEKTDPNLVQLDVYSCKDFDQYLIHSELEKLNAINIGAKFLNRSTRNTRGWRMFREGMG
jgi:S-adenosylmethionine/arginine decarboxylase-like enzyme